MKSKIPKNCNNNNEMRLPIFRLLSILLFSCIHESVYCFVCRTTCKALFGQLNVRSRGNGDSSLAIGKIGTPPLFVKLATKQSTFTSEIAQISDALVQQLLLPSDRRQKDQISSLAQQLVQAKVSFDPNQCLDGPLYFSNVLEGPSPLWEKLGIPFISQNLQGQQYAYNAKEKSVINYAEIFGSGTRMKIMVDGLTYVLLTCISFLSWYSASSTSIWYL